MTKTRLVAVGAALAVLGLNTSTVAAAGRSCALPLFGPGPAYHPQIIPRDFSPSVTNRLFPLTPGWTLVYTGTKDNKNALDIFATSARTKVIDGVTTRVVEDGSTSTTCWRSAPRTTTRRTAAETCGISVRTQPHSIPRGMSSAPRAPSMLA